MTEEWDWLVWVKGAGGGGRERSDGNLALWWHGKGLNHVKMVWMRVKRVRVRENWWGGACKKGACRK